VQVLFGEKLLLGGCFGFAAWFVFFETQILRRERKVLCAARGAMFGIEI
jgi:hypothetical protein